MEGDTKAVSPRVPAYVKPTWQSNPVSVWKISYLCRC